MKYNDGILHKLLQTNWSVAGMGILMLDRNEMNNTQKNNNKCEQNIFKS